MEDTPYSNREIKEKFSFLAEKMDDHFDATTAVLIDIKEQTTRTNGRVRSLEGWRQFLLGAIAVLTAVFLPLSGWLASLALNNANKLAAVAATVHALNK